MKNEKKMENYRTKDSCLILNGFQQVYNLSPLFFFFFLTSYLQAIWELKSFFKKVFWEVIVFTRDVLIHQTQSQNYAANPRNVFSVFFLFPILGQLIWVLGLGLWRGFRTTRTK